MSDDALLGRLLADHYAARDEQARRIEGLSGRIADLEASLSECQRWRAIEAREAKEAVDHLKRAADRLEKELMARSYEHGAAVAEADRLRAKLKDTPARTE